MENRPLAMPLTRRRFVAGAAVGSAAVAALGVSASEGFAKGGEIGVSARPESEQIHTICQGCGNNCGFTAYVVDGELGKVIGDATSPTAAGNLCARGYGYTQSAFAKANLTNPLRKLPNGQFEPVSWENAYGEIASRLDAVLNVEGPEAVGLALGGLNPTAVAYGTRFALAMGTGNLYIDDVITNVTRNAAYSQVIGWDDYVADVSRANLTLLIDTSFADVTTPGLVAALQEARNDGREIVAIDPRMGDLASMADDWLAVNPGTELALLLAVCNELIRTNRYDDAFVAANVAGFDEWARAISDCTSIWAEPICGVPNEEIDSLASKLAAAAPKVAIQYGNGDLTADSYSNSGETARVVCLLNALLGAYNAEGGALLPYDYSAFDLNAVLPVTVYGDLGDALPSVAPLGKPFGASLAAALEATEFGRLKALFVMDADVAYDYAAMGGIVDALETADLSVCVSRQLTETAQACDFVLPLASYLESPTLPVFMQGQTPTVSIANPVVVNPKVNAKPISDIITELAQSCGLQAAFDFTVEEAAAKQLEAAGLTLSGVQEDGTTALPQGAVARVSTWNTPTGKIQCSSAACADAGLSAVPVWVAPLVESNVREVIEYDQNFGQHDQLEAVVDEERGEGAPDVVVRIISGQQSVLGTEGYDVVELTGIVEKYQLDRVWVNAQLAELLGIEDGEEVGLANELVEFAGPAFVTQRIAPTAVYVPSGLGRNTKDQLAAAGEGMNALLFCQPVVREAYGTICTQIGAATLTKEGE